MAFGQQSGPPANHSQLRELGELLEQAGYSDFRDARGPMGFTQRQAGGKFTRDEADALIQKLQEEAWIAEGVMEAPDAEPAPKARAKKKAVAPKAAVRPKVAKPKAAPRPKTSAKSELILADLTDKQLATELQSRGWVVMEP